MMYDTAAIYCRLSQDDGSVGESGSIQTQRTLLTQYCKEHGIAIGDYYCDDGWSGTNFDRPEFKRMMDDIEAGNVNIVIVKDLSRFGREYAQMGMYIEHYFEEKGVRFISVAENIDTANGTDGLVLPFTNVINSFYARQVSSKTKAAHQARAKAGMYIGSHAPFGYVKDPSDRHHLIPDTDAAEVVKSIFNMFADGLGLMKITKILRERGVLNPQAYFNHNNPDYYNSDYWRQPCDWHTTSVRVILNNPVYLGKVVFGRTKTKGFFDKSRLKTDEEDWIVVEGTHKPLISQELWDTVHQMMGSRRRENTRGEIQPFAGLVKCADCSSAMKVTYNAKKKKYISFSCQLYKTQGKERCSSHYISWNALYKLVLDDIRRNAICAKYGAEGYAKMLAEMKDEKQKKEVDRLRRELKKAEKRISELDKILTKLYEDFALEKLSEERYSSMAAGYEAELKTLTGKREKLTTDIAKSDEVYENIDKFIPLVEKYTDIKELNAHILNELIEKIVVHEKEEENDGCKFQQVDIYYKFIGYVNYELNCPVGVFIGKWYEE